MNSNSFDIYESVDIKSWCAKIEDARKVSPELEQFLDEDGQLDFGDPEALQAYNIAVAKVIADLDIQVPNTHLIPAVCLRYAYVRILVDNYLETPSTILEIGTGASAIISQICAKSFGFQCCATEINPNSYLSARENVFRNNLLEKITLLKSEGQIIKDLIDNQTVFDAVLTYPPTYGNSSQDINKLNKLRGFKGVGSEMIGGGISGFEFTEQYLTESCSHEISIRLVTVLCLFKSHVIPSIQILKDNGREVRVFEIIAGTRKRYLVVGERT